MEVGDLFRFSGIALYAIVLTDCSYNIVTVSPDLQNATLVLIPPSIAADGVNAAMASLTVSLKDGGADGIPVQILMDGSTNGVVQPTQVTDSNGLVTAFITSRQAGAWPVRAFVRLGAQTVMVGADSPLIVTPVSVPSVTAYLASGGVPGSVVAGQSVTFTISANDANGALVTNFADTVQFTSDDLGAMLPPSYAFTPVDGGRHTFNAVFATAGTHTLDVVDLNTGASAPSTLLVTAASATELILSGLPANANARVAFSGHVQALDPYHNIATGYQGAVTFSSSDPQAALPGVYTFTASDGGQHTFAAMTLATAGTQSINVHDTTTGALSDTQNVLVAAASPTHLAFSSLPSSMPVCTTITPGVQVGILDAYGNTVTSASAAVTLVLSANLSGATLAGTTLQATAGGVATFNTLSLNALGNGYVLTASAAGLLSAVSSAFSVVAAPPTVIPGPPAGTSNLITIPYTVKDACSFPATITVMYSVNGNTFAQATQGASVNANGVYNVPTSPAGQSLQFAWDSAKDIPDANVTSAAIRITATTQNGSSTAIEPGLSVNNGVQFTAVSPGTSTTSSCIAVADPNHDAKMDLLAGGSGTINVLSGNGNLVFATSATLPSPSSAAIATGDVDHNGHDDFVVANANAIVVYTSGADGNTWTSVIGATLASQKAVRLADVSHDGNLDILCGGNGSFSYALGKGDGTFNAPITTARGSIAGLAVTDFNKDGNSEVIVADTSGGTSGTGEVAIYAISHTATTVTAWATLPTAQPVDVDVGDFNRDGNQDVVIANFNGGVTVASGTGTPTFNALTSIACMSHCVRARLGDMDGDAMPDVVTASTSNTIVVNRGNGTGSFSPSLTYPLAGQPFDIALHDVNFDNKVDIAVATAVGPVVLANRRVPITWDTGGVRSYYIDAGLVGTTLSDFNHDGKPDVAVSSNGNNRIDVLLNDGAGGLTLQQTLSITQPQLPTSADLNGDGYGELVVPTKSGNAITVFLNNAGQLQSGGTYPTGAAPSQVALADLDRDGKLDAVVANAGAAQLSVLLGQGNGIFGAATAYTVPSATTAVGVGYFNQDTLLDVAAASQNSNRLFVLFNTNNTTSLLGPAQSLATDALPSSLAVGDFNKDGYSDLATAAFTANTIDVFVSNGNNSFGASVPLTTYNGGPTMVVTADFDGDGKPDLLSVAQNTNTLYVNIGNGNGSFAASMNANYATDLAPLALSVGDLTGDGAIDAVVTNALDPAMPQQSISVMRSAWHSFVDVTRNVSTTSDTLIWSALADFNLDGITDGAFVSDASAGYASIRLGDGTGDFSTGGGSDISLPLGQYAAAADVNLDGWPDLLMSAGGNPYIQVLLNSQGAFSTAQTVKVGSGGSSYPVSVATPDMDHNGAPDLVVVDTQSSKLSIALGHGDGTFATPTAYPCGTRPISLDVGDINNNGLTDLVVAYTGKIGIFPGQTGGTVGTCTTLTVTNLYEAFVADLNDDGWLDIVAVNNDAINTVSVFLNVNGSFGTSTSYTVAGVAVSGTQVFGTAGDVNGDGKIDVLVGNWQETNAFAVLLGTGQGPLAPPMYFVAYQDATNLHVTDLDRNGLPDIVAPSTATGFKGVGILLGR